MTQSFVFTSESVTEGHPDKLCDQISDAIVDEFLRRDRFSRVVAETAVATGLAFIAARFASQASVDLPTVARRVIDRVGYQGESFNARTCSIMTSINELADGRTGEVDEHDMSDEEIERIAASNLITLFGYACDQTPMLMPLPIWLSHKVARRLAAVRQSGDLPYLSPDGTIQVAVEFRDREPVRIHSVTVVTGLDDPKHRDGAGIEHDIRHRVVDPAFEGEPIAPDRDSHILINPGGPFPVGGPAAHAGLTGRKVAADTYGGFSRQSAAALSGKDPTRIDRVGAYAARYAARNVVAAHLARECEVQLSYSIGAARPVSLQVNTFGSGKISDAEIADRLRQTVDFRPGAIIRQFDLRDQPRRSQRGFYTQLAAYGHVGRQDIGLPWEVSDIKKALKG